MNKHLISLSSLCLALLCGCSMPIHNTAIRPIYPKVGHGVKPEVTDSLSPTFLWRSENKEPCTYDFAIWDVGDSTQVVNASYMEFRPYIYYREGLATPEHKLEIPLAPDTPYFWSVRIREGKKVSPWATHDAYVWGVVVVVHAKNYPYRFRTPPASPGK